VFSGFAFIFKEDRALFSCGFQLVRSMNIILLDPSARGSAGEAEWGIGAETGSPPALLSTCLALRRDLSEKSRFSLTSC